eukprot:8317840-Pyramimonas_sp.AAC.1
MLRNITSGIIQGCPASGALFAVSIAPSLQRLRAVIDRPDRGTTRACADDVGMALRLSVHLLRASRVFEEAERAANLRAKSITCTIAPLCGPLTARLNCRIKAWLLEQIPAWKDS